ncbi:MAG: YfhO family protein [Syntrophaceae bacterium]|nr:YfhO family protein [Syntrophaceae bacterium]
MRGIYYFTLEIAILLFPYILESLLWQRGLRSEKNPLTARDKVESTSQLLSATFHAIKVALSYSLLYTVFFSPVIFSGRFLAPGDGTHYYLPNFYMGKMFWDPLILSGFPVAADPQAMAWYPLSIIFSFFKSWNGFILSAYVLSSSFCYGYVYTVTRSPLAGFVGGIIYGMSGCMMVHLGHTSIIHTVVWMPLLIWAMEMLGRRFTPSWFIIACLAVSCSALAGHPQMMVYIFGLTTAYVIVAGYSKRSSARLRYYLSYLGIIALGLSLSAIQLIPSAELASLGLRAQMSFADFVSYSFHPLRSVTLFFPALLGGLQNSFYGVPYFAAWNLVEMTGYVGLLSFMLAGIGFILQRDRPLAWFWIGVTSIAFLLVMGEYTPLAKFVYSLPVYNKFRVPARHFFEITLAISVLSGLGISALEKRMGRVTLVQWAMIAGLGLILFGLVVIFSFSQTLQTMAAEKGFGNLRWTPWSNPAVGIPLIIFFLSSLSLIFWSRESHSRLKQLFLISVLIIDLGSFSWFHDWRYGSPKKEEALVPTKFAQHYRNLLVKTNQRIAPIRGALGSPEELPPNISRLWKIPSVSGYGPLLLSRVSELLSLLPHGEMVGSWASAHDQSLDIMAAKFVFLPRGNVHSHPLTSSKNISWSSEDSAISLGYGCGPSQPLSIHLPLTHPLKATIMGIVSSLACSVNIPDHTEVVRIILTDIYGKTQSLSLLAGRDSSEWAFDCEEVRPLMHHQRAKIFQSFLANPSKRCEGHRYVALLPIGLPTEIKNIDFHWTGPSGIIGIQKITLFDEPTGQSYFILGRLGDLANPARWHYIEDIGSINVYENLRAMPRAWLVSEVVSAKAEEILHAIKSSQLPNGRPFNPSQTALVEEPLSFKVKEWDEKSTAQVVHLSNTNMEIHTHSASPSFLVLSDVYYPGWEATIDGKPTHIFQTNYVLRGVMIPQGGHIVRFEFKPKVFYVGAVISALSLLFLIGFLSYQAIHFKRGKGNP